MPQDEGTLKIEGAQLIFRNFAGKEGQYNREGDRNFSIVLDPPTAKAMEPDGWNVKQLRAREDADEGDEPNWYLQVSVNYRGRPPKIVMLSSGGRQMLGEDDIEVLDWSDLAQVDVIVRPYHWTVNGKTGVKAYLKTMFVTLDEDELEQKYAEGR